MARVEHEQGEQIIHRVTRHATTALLLLLIAAPVLGLVLVLTGQRTIGLGVLVAALIARGIIFVGSRVRRRFANRNAKPS
jgi:hypothetical protein